MAEKTFNTRLKLKYDSHANWTLNNPVLLAGEVAITTIPAATGDVKQAPSVLMKVGDGVNTYNDLKFVSGLAANVSNWALAATKPVYAADEITGLADYINGEIKDTNTTYQLVKVDDYNYKLQSKELDGNWIDVANSTIVIPKYDDTAVKADITALQGLVGDTAVATQIANAIAALNLAETYEAKGSAATALTNAKSYTDALANGAVKTNTDAIAAIKDGTTIDSFADVETELGKKEAAGAAAQALTDAKSYTDALANGAVKNAQDAADAAQGDVDTLEGLVGAVPEGKTVVGMIAEAQTAATYDDTAVRGLIKDNADAIDAIEADYLKAADKNELQGQITDNTDAIAVLNGTGDGSVDKKVADAVAGVVANAPEDLDTLKEIADYIASDKTGAAELSNRVAANENAIGKATVGDTPGTGIIGDIEGLDARLDTAEGKISTLEGVSHTHTNKALLDTYTQTEANLADAVSKKHAHANASTLNGITDQKVSAWDTAVTDLDALEAKVGTVPTDKTVVGMIAEAQAAATYDDTAVRGLISGNTTAIEGVAGRVTTLEQNAVLTGDTLILDCGTSVI